MTTNRCILQNCSGDCHYNAGRLPCPTKCYPTKKIEGGEAPLSYKINNHTPHYYYKLESHPAQILIVLQRHSPLNYNAKHNPYNTVHYHQNTNFSVLFLCILGTFLILILCSYPYEGVSPYEPIGYSNNYFVG